MKIKDLIKKLGELDPELEVVVRVPNDYEDYAEVDTLQHGTLQHGMGGASFERCSPKQANSILLL